MSLTPKELRERLRQSFVWQGDRTDEDLRADVTGWWRDAEILGSLGPALTAPFESAEPTAVVGVQSRGPLVGALAALALGVGLVEVRKDQGPSADSDAWLHITTPPDYRDRHLRLGLRSRHLQSGDRVLAVDDWVETGGQLVAAKRLVEASGARWLGASVIVDGLADARLRRELTVNSLLHVREL